MDPQIALIITALGTALATLIASIASLIVQIRTKQEVTTTKEHINSRMDELLRIATAKARAEGVLEGRGNS